MPRSSIGALSLLLSLAMSLISAAGAGDAWGDPLQNVLAVKLTMPEPGAGTVACGLSRAPLEAAFFAPLARRGVEAVTSGTGYRIFLRATTIGYLEKTCVSYVEAQLLLTTRYQDAANQQERSGHVLLWSDGGLFASDARQHQGTLERAMGRLGDKLAARWDIANPGSN